MKFERALTLINEFSRDEARSESEEIVVGRKTYRGAANDLAVEIVRFKNDSNLPFVRVYSKDDPNKTGHVPYKTFKDAMSAFDSMTSMVKTVDYIRNYVNELDSYKWLNILKDEDIEAIKNKTGTEMPGMAPMGGAPPGGEMGGGGLGGLEPMGGGTPPAGGEATPGGAPGEVPGGAPGAAPATPEAGAPAAPEAGAPAPETTPTPA